MSEQLAMGDIYAGARCRHKGCTAPVIGSSTQARDKHVCRRHNEIEWGEALREYDPPLSRALLSDQGGTE